MGILLLADYLLGPIRVIHLEYDNGFPGSGVDKGSEEPFVHTA